MRIFLAGERGAAAIEFAIIAPILLILFLGMANLGIAFLEQGRLDQVTRETAQAALFSQDMALLNATMTSAISELGSPISGSNYTGSVKLLCICPGSQPLVGCTVAQAALCPSTGLPWEIVIEIIARIDFSPIAPGFNLEKTLQSTLHVQVR